MPPHDAQPDPAHADQAGWLAFIVFGKAGAGPEHALHVALRRYAFLWLLATAFSCAYYIDHIGHLRYEMHPHVLLWDAFVSKALTPGASGPCCPAGTDATVQWIGKNMHPATSAPMAMVKLVIVVSLALMWFSTFIVIGRHHAWVAANTREWSPQRRRRWWRKPVRVKRIVLCLSILSPLPFVLAMAGEYEPAVFVMALAAIYVAAEHYSSLEETREELQHRVNELGEHIGTLLNADGLVAWRAKLYNQYRTAARRIDAVVRYFDIDPEWWQCYAAPDPWTEYVDRADAAPQKGYLLNVLADEKCLAKIQFVADLPMPMLRDGVFPLKTQHSPVLASYFRDLLGLAWQLTVLAKVRARRRERHTAPGDYAYARIKVAGAPSWMHVIDSKTYQVIERQEIEQATVRELDLDITDTPGKIRLSDWARRNVRHFAFRGTLGEEHLLATLRRAALLDDSSNHLNGTTLDPVLCLLGMEDYLAIASHRDLANGNWASATPLPGQAGYPIGSRCAACALPRSMRS